MISNWKRVLIAALPLPSPPLGLPLLLAACHRPVIDFPSLMLPLSHTCCD